MSEGALPSLTPESVASFLRTAPGLDSEAIGKYLGEVGQAEVSMQSSEGERVGVEGGSRWALRV